MLLLMATIVVVSADASPPAAPAAGPCMPDPMNYDPACDVNRNHKIDVQDTLLTAGHWGQFGRRDLLMPTGRTTDHIGRSKFKVEISGVTVASFTAIEGIEARTEVITYVDGDDHLVRKRPGRTVYSNIIFKRGVINTEELWKWYKTVIDGNVQRQNGSIIVLDEQEGEIFRYNFYDAWPCRWKSLELDAAVPGALIEELEVVVENVSRD